MAHKASTECLQFSLLAAAALASSHVRHPALFLSLLTVLRQVVLGLPLFLFPSGVHDRAMLVWLFLFCRRTCPIIFHLLLLTSSLRRSVLCPVLISNQACCALADLRFLIRNYLRNPSVREEVPVKGFPVNTCSLLFPQIGLSRLCS